MATVNPVHDLEPDIQPRQLAPVQMFGPGNHDAEVPANADDFVLRADRLVHPSTQRGDTFVFKGGPDEPGSNPDPLAGLSDEDSEEMQRAAMDAALADIAAAEAFNATHTIEVPHPSTPRTPPVQEPPQPEQGDQVTASSGLHLRPFLPPGPSKLITTGVSMEEALQMEAEGKAILQRNTDGSVKLIPTHPDPRATAEDAEPLPTPTPPVGPAGRPLPPSAPDHSTGHPSAQPDPRAEATDTTTEASAQEGATTEQ